MRDGLFRDGLTKRQCGRRKTDGRQLIARGTDACHVCSLALMLCLVLTCKQVNTRQSTGPELG